MLHDTCACESTVVATYYCYVCMLQCYSACAKVHCVVTESFGRSTLSQYHHSLLQCDDYAELNIMI
jgi:hypothetical protein